MRGHSRQCSCAVWWTHLPSLHQPVQHDNAPAPLQNHPPKVTRCLLQRPLGGYVGVPGTVALGGGGRGSSALQHVYHSIKHVHMAGVDIVIPLPRGWSVWQVHSIAATCRRPYHCMSIRRIVFPNAVSSHGSFDLQRFLCSLTGSVASK